MGPTPHGSKVLLGPSDRRSPRISSGQNRYQYVTGHATDFGKKVLKILEAGRNERRDDVKESSQLQKDDESGIESVVKELSASHSCSKEKVEKREEKDEDMMMTSQIRSLLQQFHLVLTVQDALLLAHARYAPPGRSHGE
ncbi:unnamed protein product [Peronospora farinosa]|uniref:Uncharacterized protein n=1 Tax=Peronospora farinosa TaxID=134698 RepID=A0AAV0TA98_9STRA|nr:unnamed protein product [Peronospora farinosa]